jgi:hypothetical protein
VTQGPGRTILFGEYLLLHGGKPGTPFFLVGVHTDLDQPAEETGGGREGSRSEASASFGPGSVMRPEPWRMREGSVLEPAFAALLGPWRVRRNPLTLTKAVRG